MEHPTLENSPEILDNPESLLAAIRRYVVLCLRYLEAGHTPMMEGLDAQVKMLCAQVEKMEAKTAEMLRPKMDSLVAELDDLAKALNEERVGVVEQLNDLGRQQQGLTAYQRASVTGDAAKKAEEK